MDVKASDDEAKPKKASGVKRKAQSGDCTEAPFELPEGVEVYYDEPYEDVPVPKGCKIFYHCTEGRFPDGKTWRVGACGKDGKFNIEDLEACTTEAIKSSDEPKAKKSSGVKRTAQSGDCTEAPFELPEGVEVYYDEPYDDVPVPKGCKIFYHCTEGRFPDGKTWRVGACGKDGTFNIKDLEPCSMDVKASDDEAKPKKASGVKRKAQSGDCTEAPFELPEGVEVYYDEPYEDVPVPKGCKIFYHCTEGRFPDGKTWRVGACGKDGKFNIEDLEACSMDVKASDDEPKAKKSSGVKRTAQAGGSDLIAKQLVVLGITAL